MTVVVQPSHVKAAAAWIVAAARAGVAQVTGYTLYIGYGEPIGGDPDDQVYLLDVESDATLIGMRTPTAAAAQREELLIPIKISVLRESDDGQEPFERCVDIVNILVAAVRADPTLGGIALDAEPQRVSYPSPAAAESGQGRVCDTELIIAVTGVN